MLIEEVRKYNVIWDPALRGYKDINKKNAAWKAISKSLANIDGKYFKHFSIFHCFKNV